MEKHKCNLCFRSFSNGRALGGHMRSHTMNHQYLPSKLKKTYQHQYRDYDDDDDDEEEEEEEQNDHQLSEELESLPSSFSEEEEEEDEEIEIGIRNKRGEKGLIMCKQGLRENQRKRNIYLLDPEFCSSAAIEGTATDSVVVQDRESETESSKKSICRRSKRIKKSRISDEEDDDNRGLFSYSSSFSSSYHKYNNVTDKQGRKSPIRSPLVVGVVENEQPVSSISDTTPEEDLAYCLMMLSRDKWKEEEEDAGAGGGVYLDSGSGAINDNADDKVTKTKNRGKFRCETCNKVFRSYQALGGHRASHKRTKVNNIKSFSSSSPPPSATANRKQESASKMAEEKKKIHECPVCYRVFSSGQALGGHKRSHFIGGGGAAPPRPPPANISSTIPSISKPISRFGQTLIDLNLPAPMDDDEENNYEEEEDDDDASQIELSAVSDAEFYNPIIRQ